MGWARGVGLQRHVLMPVDLPRHRPQRRLMALLAAGPLASAAFGQVGLDERRQRGRLGFERYCLLFQLFDPLLQFRDVLVFLGQLHVTHTQLVLQAVDLRLQQRDRPAEPVSFVALYRPETKLSRFQESRAWQNHGGR